jgi:hypothetical protein
MRHRIMMAEQRIQYIKIMIIGHIVISEYSALSIHKDDDNKPVWPTWAVGVISGVRNVETIML